MYFMLVTLVCLASVGLLVLFGLTFCTCDRAEETNPKRVRFLWFTTLGSSVFFFIFLISCIVLTSKVSNKTDFMNCAIAMVPEELLEGSKLVDYEFVGLKPLS